MNLEALQKVAEQSLFDQWETLLAKFQSDIDAIEKLNLETRVLFETMTQQVFHTSSLSTSQNSSLSINNWGDLVENSDNQDYWVDMIIVEPPCWLQLT